MPEQSRSPFPNVRNLNSRWVLLLLSMILGLPSCTNKQGASKKDHENRKDQSVSVKANPITKDGVRFEKEEMARLYTLAITQFIKAANKRDQTTWDTLFFGKHQYGNPEDFPDIELPASIENTYIQIVPPEAGPQLQERNPSSVYINLMAWFENHKAQFIFVVFKHGMKHQYDGTFDFQYNHRSKDWQLEKITFEDYAENNP